MYFYQKEVLIILNIITIFFILTFTYHTQSTKCIGENNCLSLIVWCIVSNPAGILPKRRKIQNEQIHQNVIGDTSKKKYFKAILYCTKREEKEHIFATQWFSNCYAPWMLFQSVAGRKLLASKDGLTTDFVIKIHK